MRAAVLVDDGIGFVTHPCGTNYMARATKRQWLRVVVELQLAARLDAHRIKDSLMDFDDLLE